MMSEICSMQPACLNANICTTKHILTWLILKKNIQECKHASYSKVTMQSAPTALMQFIRPMTHLLTYLSYMEKI